MNTKEIYIIEDTIVGISTAIGASAIAIIRLSGKEAIKIANRMFIGKNLELVPSHTIHHGFIKDKNNTDTIDEVLISVFRAPKTYTREDIVEINSHGGIYIANQILELALENGARLADAGEFTKRAFLKGRIDLTKAEAVMDIIDAENKSAIKLANKGLRGATKKLIENYRREILDLIAIIAVNIDYPEYDDVVELTNETLLPKIKDISNRLKEVIDHSFTATLLKNGISTVIIGKPNVGKSSLLNALLGENKAIVTDIPGTTRDTVEGVIHLGSLMLNLIDTAGIRLTEDIVEKIGVDKSKSKIAEADLVLIMIDGSAELTKEDEELIALSKNKPAITIINKNDLPQLVNINQFNNVISISTFSTLDIIKLEKKIEQTINLQDINNLNATYISNVRQIQKIKEAYSDLQNAIVAIKNNNFIDLIEIHLRSCWTRLGEILGEVSDDELINELFSKFCLGK